MMVINGRKGTTPPYRIPISKCQRIEGDRKTIIEFHGNNGGKILKWTLKLPGKSLRRSRAFA